MRATPSCAAVLHARDAPASTILCKSGLAAAADSLLDEKLKDTFLLHGWIILMLYFIVLCSIRQGAAPNMFSLEAALVSTGCGVITFLCKMFGKTMHWVYHFLAHSTLSPEVYQAAYDPLAERFLPVGADEFGNPKLPAFSDIVWIHTDTKRAGGRLL